MTADMLMLLHGRRRCRDALGLPPDDLDRVALAGLRQPEVAATREVELVRFVPAHVWADVVELGGPAHESLDEHRAGIEAQLRSSAEGLPRVLVPLDDLPAYASARGVDPRAEQTVREYLLYRDRAGEVIAWPPARNDACWCGSAVKYKRCCGRPTA